MARGVRLPRAAGRPPRFLRTAHRRATSLSEAHLQAAQRDAGHTLGREAEGVRQSLLFHRASRCLRAQKATFRVLASRGRPRRRRGARFRGELLAAAEVADAAPATALRPEGPCCAAAALPRLSVSGHADPNQRPFLTAAPPARAAASSPAHGGDKTALAAWIPKSRVYGPCHRARHVCIGRGRRRRRARTLVRVVRSGTEISAGPFLRSSWPSVSPTSGPGHPHGLWGHHKPTSDAEQDAAGFRAEPRTHMLGGST